MTKDVSIDENECYQNQEHAQNFIVSSWTHFITAERQNSKIQHAEELVGLGYLFQVIEAVIFMSLYVNEVERWSPDTFTGDNDEPHAADTMKNEHQNQQ